MDKETLLVKYLQDKLAPAELSVFKEMLDTDAEFKKEVEFQTDVKRAIVANEDDDFMEMLSEFEAEARAKERVKPIPKTQKNSRLPIQWLVAASLLVLLGLSYWFFQDNTADTTDLFAQNFVPYRNVTHPVTRGDAMVDSKTQAFSAYGKGDFNKAISLFTQLYASDKEPYYLFYKANALIQINKASEAVPLLKEHLKTKDALSDKSNWYLAMAYLQLKDADKAKAALQRVVETKAYKAEDAKRLLDAL
ncbi:tetratricopeptide repeat protein [Maribacter sp. 2-571]|uniref:tetratricopeptide repeat protein n=1 Tax=Maribacter sp. 2-571 TaxID=3417569 RepID=UPI003D33E2D1